MKCKITPKPILEKGINTEDITLSTSIADKILNGGMVLTTCPF